MNGVADLSLVLHRVYSNILSSFLTILQRSYLHVGEYKITAKGQDMYGWLICDGRSLNRADYPELFQVIGTSFGSLDAHTFKLPDFRGRVIGQPGQGSGLTNRVFGDIVGEETHTLSSNEMPSHSHTGDTNASGSHTHTASANTTGSHTHTITDPGHTHTQTTINDDFNSSGTNPPGFAADSAGTRTWSNINSATTGITVDSGGAHTHTITVDTDGSHSHAFATASAGGGNAHNNMQPTLFAGYVMIYTGVVTSL